MSTQVSDSTIRALFNRIDENMDNVLSQEEVMSYAEKMRLPRAYVEEFLGPKSGGFHGFFGRREPMSIDKFSRLVREKEESMLAAFKAMDADASGKISEAELEQGLAALEISGNKYEPRKRISRKGVNRIMQAVDRGRPIDFDHFRDLFVLVDAASLENITPYYMRVSIDLGRDDFAVPDKRKGGMPLGHIVAGGLAGIMSKSLTSPLNVLTVRAQVVQGARIGLVDAAKSIMAENGLPGFWKGNLANCIRSAPSKACDFFAYDLFKNLLTEGGKRPLSDGMRLVAGALAGSVSATVLYPLEVISSRMMMPNNGYKSTTDCLLSIVRQNGIGGLYAGIGPTLMGIVPYAGINFAAYDILREAYKRQTGKEHLSTGATLAMGMVAGWLAMTVSFPLEVVRRRLQVQGSAGGKVVYAGALDCAQQLMKEGGVGAFYRGWVAGSMKIIPAAGISFLTYELAKKVLMHIEEERTLTHKREATLKRVKQQVSKHQVSKQQVKNGKPEAAR
eukprot:jgi/Mesvir1/16750/Mv25086-RA.2